MSRIPFVAGNWKMNTTADEGRAITGALVKEVGSITDVKLAVCPPPVYLMAIAEVISGSSIALGAQNMYCEDKGAYTAEVSAQMLLDCGCTYVICGHSERRHVFGEPDALINRKVLKALSAGLRPILCVGETLDEREAGRTMDVVERQVAWGLHGVSAQDADKITIAYEPVWAIGTGKVAEASDANEVHAFIRTVLSGVFSSDAAASITIQYGGSVKEKNAAGLAEMPEIDGFLVGGASLKADEFARIIKTAQQVKCS